MPTIRTVPEDFQVEELPLYVPEGHGPFLWLWVEKCMLDTEALERSVAGFTHDVGDEAVHETDLAGNHNLVLANGAMQ